MAAQNQHYVPKFILRNFLSNDRKERVTVYDKQRDEVFSTSIANVMAERRFNEFAFEEFIASFEDIATQLEQAVIPRYRQILERRALDNTPEEKVDLAFLIAFQFVRTRAHRDRWAQLINAVRDKTDALGFDVRDIDGFVEPDENEIKKQHLLNLRHYIAEFAPIIASKNFMLMEAPKGRFFYLGDNPVVLNNQEDHSPYGNLGLAVRGIEIYMPLSADLVLCALCPSIASKLREEWKKGDQERRKEIGAAISQGRITIQQGIAIRDQLAALSHDGELKVKAFECGGTIQGGEDQVDFINSLETMYSSRFVVCKKGDLGLARQHNKEFPHYRKGKGIEFLT